MQSEPIISVIMPVYNAARFLQQAIESILQQSFSDFEFIILNDGSTDTSARIIQDIQDSRIRYIDNGNNLGLVATLNKGIQLAKGRYIMRMDADDISLPDRFERQVRFMEENPAYGVCSSIVQIIDEQDQPTGIWRLPEHVPMRTPLMTECPIVHPAACIRRSVLGTLRYDSSYFPAEDFHLWVKLNAHTALYNFQTPLLRYRSSQEGISRKQRQQQRAVHLHIVAEQLQKVDPHAAKVLEELPQLSVYSKAFLQSYSALVHSPSTDASFFRYVINLLKEQGTAWPFIWMLNIHRSIAIRGMLK